MTTTIATKPVSALQVGDQVIERDGALLRVEALETHGQTRMVVTLSSLSDTRLVTANLCRSGSVRVVTEM